MTLSNKVYDTLKWIAQILLPGLGTLYFAISGIWGLPYCEQVVGTLSAIKMQGATYKTKLSIPMDELTEKKSVILKVEDGDKK